MPQAQPDLQTHTSTLADGRTVVTRRMHASAEDVWAVLADGWLYANWVVGASRIRQVDPEWPDRNSRLHHSFGVWPVLVDDHTEVLAAEAGRELLLRARGWPAGAARIQIRVTGASGHESIVSMAEDAAGGPIRLIPRPARQLLIAPRNAEALRRLALIAEGRHRGRELLMAPSTDQVDRRSAWRRSS